jgi:putative membrane protein
MTDLKPRRSFSLLLAWCAALLVWSAIAPRDYGVWVFESLPGLIGIGLVAALHRRFSFSPLVHALLAAHFAVLAVGAKYTYAEMPLFSWLRDALSLSRNHYDRVGHFMQGFVPAIIVREILLRCTTFSPGKMLGFLCVCVCLAFSALWEIIETWTVIVFYPTTGQEWLGMQGDIWDAQHDMTMALTGAALAVLTLSRLHDRSMTATAPCRTKSDREYTTQAHL